MINLKVQATSEVVDVYGLLSKDEDLVVYPEGARDKSSFIWPESVTRYDFAIPGRRYLFKRSNKNYPEQYWVEIFAYQLGCLVGVNVPPAFVAFNSSTDEAGALIEWFYDSEADGVGTQEMYIQGGDLFQAIIQGFERRRGEMHNFESIVGILSSLVPLNKSYLRDFIRMLTFDALLGNTDRHQDNWGIILSNTRDRMQFEGRIAPAFDNGTSMGHEINAEAFSRFNEELHIRRYVKRGRPHLKWDLREEYDSRGNQEELIQHIVQTYPHFRQDMLSCLDFTQSKVESIMGDLLKFDVPNRLTEERARFMLHLLQYRQERLKLVLGEVSRVP